VPRFFFALTLCLSLAAGASVDRTASLPDLKGQRVIVAVEDDFPPFNYVRTDTRKAEGWDYEMIAELGRRLHFQPDFREIAWDSMVQGIATGQFDLAGNGITVTDERARVVDFSTAYAQVHQRLMVRKSEKRFDSLPSFAKAGSAKLGAQKGNTNYTKAQALVGAARVVAYDGFGELVQALLSGDLDAVIIDDVGGQGYVGMSADQLRLLDGQLDAQDLAFVFPKNSALRQPVDEALAQMRADGTLARLNGKWFSPAFRPAGAP
jgi:polar amino acid transport system substrate-binding protein